MEIIKYYGSDTEKKEFINHDNEPLIAAIAHDGSHAVVSLLDEGCEHHLLLAKALDRHDIDKYFRIRRRLDIRMSARSQRDNK